MTPAIEVTGLSSGGATCSPLTLITSFGPIRLSVPLGAAYDLDARTSFGRIRSEVPLTTTGVAAEDALRARVGGGGCPASLSNSNGNIEIVAGAKLSRP